MLSNRLRSICIGQNEKYIFAGDKFGRIHIIDAKMFTEVNVISAHFGSIDAIVSHPNKPIIAALGKDRAISLWLYDDSGTLNQLAYHSIRNYFPKLWKEYQVDTPTIALHPEKDLIATTSGGAALLELNYSLIPVITVESCQWLAEIIHYNSGISTVRYDDNGDLLAGEQCGGKITRVRNGEIIEQITLSECSKTIHWFEPCLDDSFLVATDARCLLRYYPDRSVKYYVGKEFCTNDCVYVIFDKNTCRVFAASLDCNVYELELETLRMKRIAYKPNLEIRWLHCMESEPDTLIVQIGKGTLAKIDIHSGNELLYSNKNTEVDQVHSIIR